MAKQRSEQKLSSSPPPAGDRTDPPLLDTLDAALLSLQKSRGQYVAYPKALHQLAGRFGATSEEMAAWVYSGPADGGLAAYLNVNEIDPPPRFNFPLGNFGENGDDHDYVAPMMACWFKADELASFNPQHRYITGGSLIARWQDRPGLKTEAYIVARIRESRLSDLHPIYGLTQGTLSTETSSPPLISGLFKLSEVEQIEAEDFPMAPAAEDRLPTTLTQASDCAVAGQVAAEASAAVQPMALDALERPHDIAEGGEGKIPAESPVTVFRNMSGLDAEELTIAFVGDAAEFGLGANNMLKISARTVVRTVPLAALDLVDRRKGTLNSQCAVLLGMASGKELPPDDSHPQKLTRLREIFKKHLGLDNPFHPYSERTGGGAPRFKLEDRRGAADERARQDAEKRTTSLDDLADRGFVVANHHRMHQPFDVEDDIAAAWMKENDQDGST